MLNYDWTGAGAEFRRAISLNPNYATAHHFYAVYLAALGPRDEALAESGRARALDPLSRVIATSFGSVLAFERRYDDAFGSSKRPLSWIRTS